MTSRDERELLDGLATAFGACHFSVSRAHRALYPKRHPAWIPFDQDQMRKQFRGLVIAGLAVESAGPRGGAGWTLTPAGLSVATRAKK